MPRSLFEGARDMARHIGQSDAGRASRRQRKKVEILFAHLKRLSLRQVKQYSSIMMILQTLPPAGPKENLTITSLVTMSRSIITSKSQAPITKRPSSNLKNKISVMSRLR